MKHTEKEMQALKDYHIEMWNLVQGQIKKAYDALRYCNKDLAREVIARERIVNAQELLVDHHCEDFIALFAPKAVDLRFVISLLKMTNNLERIADIGENIALFVLYNQTNSLTDEVYVDLKLDEMMEITEKMLTNAREALVNENSLLCGKILTMDHNVDELYRASIEYLAEYIGKHPEKALEMLYLNGVIRRIERIGDRAGNIAEDIVFFVDAKELRHQK